jgi:chromosome segregation ATPase
MKGELVMKRFIVYSVCSAALVLTGCASEQRTREYVQTGTESVNQISRSIIGAKRAELADDPGVLDVYEKDFDDFVAQQRSEFARIKKEIEEAKRQREAIVSALASLAIEAIPAGSSALRVAKALGGKIDNAADKALQAANERTEKVEITGNDNKEKIGTLTEATREIAKDTENLESRVDKIEEDTAKLSEEKGTVEKELAVARERFNSLSTSIQEKLSKVPESVIVDLTKLKADDTAFREQFQREIQLTDAEMESVKGLSTQELLWLLAAAGSATGAGGLMARNMARTGPSRGDKEIKSLRIDLAKLEAKSNQ